VLSIIYMIARMFAFVKYTIPNILSSDYALIREQVDEEELRLEDAEIVRTNIETTRNDD
jgi:hypothetical protein